MKQCGVGTRNETAIGLQGEAGMTAAIWGFRERQKWHFNQLEEFFSLSFLINRVGSNGSWYQSGRAHSGEENSK